MSVSNKLGNVAINSETNCVVELGNMVLNFCLGWGEGGFIELEDNVEN